MLLKKFFQNVHEVRTKITAIDPFVIESFANQVIGKAIHAGTKISPGSREIPYENYEMVLLLVDRLLQIDTCSELRNPA